MRILTQPAFNFQYLRKHKKKKKNQSGLGFVSQNRSTVIKYQCRVKPPKERGWNRIGLLRVSQLNRVFYCSLRMFYFFFESRTNKADPVVIWLTGGPGCSSELALFYENGPFTVSNNSSLSWNEFGWDKVG